MAIKKSKTETGSIVRPSYSERTMKCYTITDSELKQIGLANVLVTAFSAIGSAFFAFGVDVFKDSQFVDAVPARAQILTQYVQPLCFFLGIALWLSAAAVWWWRRDMIALIKKESVETYDE